MVWFGRIILNSKVSMALIKCPECGKEISDKAPACIHCGFPLPKLEENKKTIFLKRSKATFFTPIAIFLVVDVILGVLIGFFATQIAPNQNSDLVFLFSIGLVIFTFASFISVAGLVIAIVDRVKNNNRININLMEYDKENNILICRNYKDETISVKPELVRYLDGNDKVYLYYFVEGEKTKKKVFTLGFAESSEISEARAMIERIKESSKE